MPVEEVTLAVGEESIPGRLNHPEEDTDRGLLMLPGAGHGPYGDIFDRLAEESVAADVACLRYRSWSSHDELDEKTLGELHREVDAAVEFLQDRGCTDVTLGAKSFGGAIALTHVPDSVSRLFLWAPALTVDEESTIEVAKTTPLGEVDGLQVDDDALEELLSGVDVPARILHGDRDHIPMENSERIAGALPEGEVVEIEGADHSFGVAQYERTIGHTMELIDGSE